MLPYEKQLFYKRQQVEDNLRRIGKIELPLIPTVLGADETTWYRNKLEYTFSSKRFFPENEFIKDSANESNAAGFHAKGMFDKIVEIERCWLQAEPTNAIRNLLAGFARKKQL